MAAVVTIGQGKVDPFIEAQLHGAAHQCADGIQIIVDGIFYILDLAAVGKIPEAFFQILFFNGSDIFCDMAVEAVADIRSVGNIFDDAIFFAELGHLQAAKAFRRGAVDGIEITVLFFEFRNLIVDMLQGIDGELPILYQRFAVVQLL